ncbi:MAG: hypothetical protein KatS3mg115_1237 [Candidatus Poribacteria bacterium]|nr:MAG: hypothetical protein KatS3mg115_1237 [Candidatus Poribacteria bacterium]
MKSTRTNEFVIGWVMGLLGLLGSPPASVWGASVAIPPRDDPAWGLLDLSGVTAAQLKGRFRNPLPIWLEPWMLRTPGDPRPYRHGVHQGIDFYGVSWGTAVYPIAPGIVIRADHDYRPMSPEDRAAMLRRCAEIGATPGEWGVPPDPIWGDVLDRLRGRQVWLYHGRNEQGEPVLSPLRPSERGGSDPGGPAGGPNDAHRPGWATPAPAKKGSRKPRRCTFT